MFQDSLRHECLEMRLRLGKSQHPVHATLTAPEDLFGNFVGRAGPRTNLGQYLLTAISVVLEQFTASSGRVLDGCLVSRKCTAGRHPLYESQRVLEFVQGIASFAVESPDMGCDAGEQVISGKQDTSTRVEDAEMSRRMAGRPHQLNRTPSNLDGFPALHERWASDGDVDASEQGTHLVERDTSPVRHRRKAMSALDSIRHLL